MQYLLFCSIRCFVYSLFCKIRRFVLFAIFFAVLYFPRYVFAVLDPLRKVDRREALALLAVHSL